MNITVGTSAIQISAVGRQKPILQNLGPGDLYLGENDEVTADNGLKLGAGAVFEFSSAISMDDGLWVIASEADTDVRYMLLGG